MTSRVSCGVLIFLFSLSILLFLFGLTFFFVWNKMIRKKKHSLTYRSIVFSICLLLATWLMRFLVGYSGYLIEDGKSILLSVPEEIVSSLVHTLQSFSLDENYLLYLKGGKALMAAVFPKSCLMPHLYSFYVSILNVLCPVIGGAVIFALLTSIFPRIKLTLWSWFPCKPIRYFSELNDRSLALAKSIRDHDARFVGSLIVFSDVYTDTDDEVVSERIQKAKLLGAICLKDDIADVSISRRKGKKIFLMDENAIGNLQALAALKGTGMSRRFHQKDEIYVFSNDDSGQMVVNSVCDSLKKELGEEKSPFIMTVNGNRNLVYNLLKNKPLFSAKDRSDAENDPYLSIVIIGSGQIGTEMFLGTYWCGQLLDYKLRITVVSNETEESFRARIDHINPEILLTENPRSELLRIYADEHSPLSPPYFSFEYVETNIRQDDMYTKMLQQGKNGRIVDADYFVVALGTDEGNLEIADKIRQYVSREKIKATDEERKTTSKKVPVAYVVFDNALNELLKENRGEDPFVDMVPFGSLGETYCLGQITVDGIRNSADTDGDSYQKMLSRVITSEPSIREYYTDSYSYWANIARAIHIKYKAFCVDASVEQYLTDAKNKDSELNRNHRLAWLEHRRWNAFMRVCGFKAPTPEEERGYIERLPNISDPNDKSNKGKHKSLVLKLHPCIVECAVSSDGAGEEPQVPSRPDLLDDVRARLKNDYPGKNLIVGNYKAYDYPLHDYH